MSIETLVQHFGTVEDPRCCGKIEHRLLDILVIAVCAVIACAESWCDIALYGRSKLAWLQTFLELPNGIPSQGKRFVVIFAKISRNRPFHHGTTDGHFSWFSLSKVGISISAHSCVAPDRDGSSVAYYALAENVWNVQTKRSEAQIIHNFGC